MTAPTTSIAPASHGPPHDANQSRTVPRRAMPSRTVSRPM